MRHVNKAGLDLIKSFETCVLHPYDDGAGYMTVGWGHLIRRGEHFDTISQEEADEILRHDLAQAESAVARLVHVPLTDNQFGALVSFTFNVGGGGLGRSSLLRELNAGHYDRVPAALRVWNKANGQVMKGLTRRREAEGKLFTTPGPTTTAGPEIAADAPQTAAPASATPEGTQVAEAPAGADAGASTGGAIALAGPERVTSGSASWARSVATWITTLAGLASGYVRDAFGLDWHVQLALLACVALLGIVWFVCKYKAEHQIRAIAADPALTNVK